MTISSHLNVFCGKVVEDFDPQEGIQDLNKVAYRLRISYDDFDSGKKIEDIIKAFVNDPKAKDAEDLIIGAYDFESSCDSSTIVQILVEVKHELPNLKNLFIGDITYEEMEISWIQQSDVSPVLKAFPALVHFQVRGGEGLSLGTLSHEGLERLIVETGGLPPNVLKEIENAHLPNLKHLELWLGSDDYGFASDMDDLKFLLSDQKFPHLKYLGLKNSTLSDELAIALSGAPVMDLLEELDLSMGTLGDEGAQALLDNTAIKNLKHLNLAYHYISDEMMDKLRQLGISIDLDNQNEDDDGDRYVEVSE